MDNYICSVLIFFSYFNYWEKHILIILILIMPTRAICKTEDNNTKFNLDFEDIINGKPRNWDIYVQPGFKVSIDSVTVYSGKYSIVIESTGESSNSQQVTLVLPNNYKGQQITLSGYIKTEGVIEGYAALWAYIQPQIAFDNMYQRGITGTTNWSKYEISLSMNPAKTTHISLGGMLVGKGKIWLDNLSINIDGKDLTEAKIFERQLFPAELDREFDKGSTIVFQPLNEQRVTNLELLGRLWGFLKFHHPEIGKGNYNWDYELFRILPSFLESRSSSERDKTLLGWIDKYGAIPNCATCKESASDAFIKSDLSWVENSGMSRDLKMKIWEIHSKRFQGDHYYVDTDPYWKNSQMMKYSDSLYNNMLDPDAGFRLLALYKFWSMIQYYYPYKYMIDKNWNDVLKEYIPLFISAENRQEYQLTVLQLIGETDNTNADIGSYGSHRIFKRSESYSAPLQVQFIEHKLVVTDYYNLEYLQDSIIKIGDIITHINGKTVESIVDSIKKFYPASNETARLRNISSSILSSNNNTINIQYISSGQVKKNTLPVLDYHGLKRTEWFEEYISKKNRKIIDGNIGYFPLVRLKTHEIPIIMDSFKNTKGIIIDIRDRSAISPISLASYFISNSTPFVKHTVRNVNNPGEFTFASIIEIPEANETYKGKVVVIVNEQTQSTGEYLTMALKASENTTIVGSTTAGAIGNFFSHIFLPGAIVTPIPKVGIYYPDGTPTQRIGIIPDVWMEPTIEGIKSGKDEVLEKAIEVMKNESK